MTLNLHPCVWLFFLPFIASAKGGEHEANLQQERTHEQEAVFAEIRRCGKR